MLNIFPYFVLGFIGMIIFRNIGDELFLLNKQLLLSYSYLIKLSLFKDYII